MSEKPETLRLADILEEMARAKGLFGAAAAAVELRRLHAEVEALRADALRYRWLRDHPSWSVSYRIRPGKSKEWRMRDDEGDLWGNWWPTHEQAVDHWIKEQTK